MILDKFCYNFFKIDDYYNSIVSENNALGKDNGLIWHLPEDLKDLKLTNNHCIIIENF